MRDQADGGRPPPVVTVSGGPASSSAAPAPPSSRGGLLAVAVALAVVASAAVLSRPAPEPPPSPLEASLDLAADALTGSQGGVLILPVDVVVRGAEARIGRVVLWAEPVRQETVLSGRTRFRPGDPGRVRVLVQPDCSLLAPSQGHRLVLTLDLELIGADGQRAQQVLDLGAAAAVAARVAALCAAPV